MNPLKEHPHLFANGKFKVSIEYYTGFEGDFWPLTGVVDGILLLEKYNGCKLENCKLDPEDCTLIARPISDMTDEEVSQWKACIYDSDMGRMIPVYANQTAYLLSIGVYPFDQKAFEDGTVIDATSL